MLFHLILGLLRDGQPRHGYGLIVAYRRLSGNTANPGNFYRELGKLTSLQLIQARETQPEQDPRQIPYLIMPTGEREFDRWLCNPTTPESELEAWLLFADRVPTDVFTELLDRTREQLWLQSKTVERARIDALRNSERNGHQRTYHPAPMLLLWHMKRLAAEIEFLAEFRQEVEALRRRSLDDDPEKD